jgi:hypothetical protein
MNALQPRRKQPSQDAIAPANQLWFLTSDQIKTLLLDNDESPTKKRRQGTTGIQTFCAVFEAKEDSATIPRLPISVQCNLPHISLPTGHDPEMKFCLSVAYDTCAACNVGYSGHHLPIAEKYPELVKSLTFAESKYTPLRLSGIVQGKSKAESKPSASLPIVIEYWMPFLTKEGQKTTLKIALGDNVSVNTIIGIPMIRPAKLSFDLIDNVVEPGILDTEPFAVTYRPTVQSSPDFSSHKSSKAPQLFDSEFEHVSMENARACQLAMATYIATSTFAKPSALKTKINDGVEVAGM